MTMERLNCNKEIFKTIGFVGVFLILTTGNELGLVFQLNFNLLT